MESMDVIHMAAGDSGHKVLLVKVRQPVETLINC